VKAIVGRRYGPPERLRLEDVPEPSAGAGEVVVRVRAASVNAGDWRLMRGQPYVARPLMGGLRGPSPSVRGWDYAGVVESVAPDVEGIAVGDEVFGSGAATFAELVAVSPERLAPKPAALSFEDAAALPVAGVTALQSLQRAAVAEGQRVLVNGASGGVGAFTVQVAKALGAEVTGVCSARNVAFVESLGADRIVDYGREDFTRERGRYDVIVDNVGNRPVRAIREALAPSGTLVRVGGGEGRVVGALAGLAMVVVVNRFVRQRLVAFLAHPTRADLLELVSLVASGRLRVSIERTYPLADTARAIAHVETGHVRGKVVVVV
jgi:NADPH:quinone reductase-like Zn-dependent oxidoreductase